MLIDGLHQSYMIDRNLRVELQVSRYNPVKGLFDSWLTLFIIIVPR